MFMPTLPISTVFRTITGPTARQAQQALTDLDSLFGALLRRLRGSNTWLLATADHGFIDSPTRRVIDLADHAQLAARLLRPLCGERRAAYCYVAPDNRPAFEAYVRRHLARATHLYASERLIAAGWFGPATASSAPCRRESATTRW
jgi:hypothetical protein